MDGEAPAAQPVPLALEPGRPVIEVLDLVDQDGDLAQGRGPLLGARPQALPEAGQRGLGEVRGSVEGRGPAGRTKSGIQSRCSGPAKSGAARGGGGS